MCAYSRVPHTHADTHTDRHANTPVEKRGGIIKCRQVKDVSWIYLPVDSKLQSLLTLVLTLVCNTHMVTPVTHTGVTMFVLQLAKQSTW